MSAPTTHKLKISVALCTFNGQSHIGMQLESIFSQSLKVDEIIVSDDGSSDETLARVSALASRSTAEFLIGKNSHREGVARNFQQALKRTTGDILFLSDQDDLWAPDKVERVVSKFHGNPNLLLVFSDARLIDDKGSPMGSTLFRELRLNSWEIRCLRSNASFEAFIRRNLATGATVAFRRELLEIASPFPDHWLHDEWLAVLASALNRIEVICKPLIDYRQHDANLIGMRPMSPIAKLAKLLNSPGTYHAGLLDRALELQSRIAMLAGLVPSFVSRLTSEKVLHAKVRSNLPSQRARRLLPIAREFCTGRYFRCSTGWRSVVRDLIAPIAPRD